MQFRGRDTQAWAAMASWTADQLGKATSDTAGLLRAGRQCTRLVCAAAAVGAGTTCGEATGMRSPCACRSFDRPPAQGSASRLRCSPSRLHWSCRRACRGRPRAISISAISAATAAWRRTRSPRSRRMRKASSGSARKAGCIATTASATTCSATTRAIRPPCPTATSPRSRVEGRDALWVGTYSEFVARLDLRDGQIKRFAIDGGAALPGSPRKQVLALLPVDGQLWVGTQGGLVRFDPKTGRSDGPADAGSAHRRAFAAAGAAARSRWRGVVRQRRGPVSLRRRWRRRAHRRRAGAFACVRSRRAPVGRPSRWLVSPARRRPRSAARVAAQRRRGRTPTCARSCRRRIAACGSRCSAMACAGSTRRAATSRRCAKTGCRARCPKSAIGKLMIDRGGALWVGGQFRGPSVTDPLGTRFRYLAGGEPRNFASGVAGNSVRAIVEDDARQWWFGTDNGELYRADAQGNALAPVEGFAERVPGTGPAAARDGFRARRRGQGVGRDDARPGRASIRRPARSPPVPLTGYPGVQLRSIARDDDGTLVARFAIARLAALRSGHRARARLHGQREFARAIDRACGRRSTGTTACGRAPATAWNWSNRRPAACACSATRRDAPTASPATSCARCSKPPTARSGSARIPGLSRVREVPATQIRFEHPLDEALGARPVPVVFSIAESPQGLLWLGTDAGLMRFDPAHGTVRAYGLADGLQDLEFNGGAALKLARWAPAVRRRARAQPVRSAPWCTTPRYMPPVRLLSARFGADGAIEAATWRGRHRASTCRPTRACCACAWARSISPTAGNIRYRYRSKASTATGSTTARSRKSRYTRAAAGQLRVPRAGDQPRWRVESAGCCACRCASRRRCGAIRWRWSAVCAGGAAG